MKLTLKTISLLLFMAASISMVIGCGSSGSSSNDPEANLALTKSVDNPTPDVGDNVVFTIAISNAGPSIANGVVVTDLLPSGFTYLSDSSGGAYDPATGQWPVGSMQVGGSRVLNITAVVNGSGDFRNRAEVAANERDPNVNNNFAFVVAAPPGINVAISQIKTECGPGGPVSRDAFVTVVDQLGDPIIDLNGLTFTLAESDGGPNQAVNNFQVDFYTGNFSIAIVMDYSQSMFDKSLLNFVEDAVEDFIDLLSAGDEAEIIKFNEVISVVEPFTSNKDDLKAGVTANFPIASITELYRAVIQGITDASLRSDDNVKAVVLITDGRNNPATPGVTLNTAINAALDNDIPVFVIALGQEADWDNLQKLASDTGGLFYPNFQPANLTADIVTLAESLIDNLYVISYNNPPISGAGTLNLDAEFNGLLGGDTKGFAACP